MSNPAEQYSLGSEARELARLELQAQLFDPATRLFLRESGIEAGMSVVEFGSGLGHVTLALSDMVGAGGKVTAVDQSAAMLEAAAALLNAHNVTNVHLVQADATTWHPVGQVDAVACRLLLVHLRTPAETLRHWQTFIRPGGLLTAIES